MTLSRPLKSVTYYSYSSIGDDVTKSNMFITDEIIKYIRTNALMYEYYKQAKEMIPNDIGKTLNKIFTSEEYILVNTRFENPA